LFGDAIPAQEHLASVLKAQVPMTCQQDNTATIQVINNGFSAKLRHLGKTHKININGLYDIFRLEEDVALQHCPTDMQSADIFTKNLEAHKWSHALSMVGIVPD